MLNSDKLMKKSMVIQGFTPKDLCTCDDELTCAEECECQAQGCDSCPVQKAFNRLAEYEALNLLPEEIKVFLADYAKMKELVSTLECAARR